MAAAEISRRARWFVTASVGFLTLWQAALLLGVGRRVSVTLGLYGFVLHMVFGKAYSLVPSYFAREFSHPIAATIQFSLTFLGTVGLALSPVSSVPPVVGALGAACFLLGIVTFVVAIGWTIRDNPTGAETGTSDANEDRRRIDRTANAFVPVVFVYLLWGAYETASLHAPLPSLVGGYAPRVTHLLAAGGAGLLVLAVGFRLVPRFLVTKPPRPLVFVALPAGALGPVALAFTLPAGEWFPIAAGVQALAIAGFALAYLVMFARSDRRRVGFYGVLLGALSGLVGVSLGLQFALAGTTPGLLRAHLRANLLGFLGLTIVGLAYQFYPPAAGTFTGASDRTALASILALAGGLAVQIVGAAGNATGIERFGAAVSLLGALVYAGLVVGLFHERYWG